MTDTMVPLSNERDMTTDEFRQWYARLGLNQVQLAKRLDIDQSIVSRWVNGKTAPPSYLRLALERLEQIMLDERRPKRRRRQQPAEADQ